MKLFDVYPLFDIEPVRGLGSTVWDKNQTPYLDLYGGHAVISIGHSHPHYVESVTHQLEKLGFYSNFIKNPLQEKLAELLGRVSQKPDYQLFLCNSGAEANENALKLASFANGRKRIVAFKGSFHGRTSLAVSVTDNPSIIAPVNENEHVIFLPLNDIEALENEFKTHGSGISSVIIEGIQGVGGIYEASDVFLQKIRSLCDQYGAYYIADSVQCGYGRSGLFFAHDHAGVSADIYTMAKGMGNGFPIGAMIAAPHFQPKFGMLGTTFGGNHLACAAAIAVLEVIEKDHLIQHAADMGSYILAQLQGIAGIHELRGKGLMLGIELDKPSENLRKKLLFEHHIFTGSASQKNTIRLLPALNLSKEDADHFLEVFKAVVVHA